MDAAATPSGAVAGTAASGVILGMVEGRTLLTELCGFELVEVERALYPAEPSPDLLSFVNHTRIAIVGKRDPLKFNVVVVMYSAVYFHNLPTWNTAAGRVRKHCSIMAEQRVFSRKIDTVPIVGTYTLGFLW